MRSERQKRRNGEREIRGAERLKDSKVFRKKTITWTPES